MGPNISGKRLMARTLLFTIYYHTEGLGIFSWVRGEEVGLSFVGIEDEVVFYCSFCD